MKLPVMSPPDNLKYTKPQVDQFLRANKAWVLTIGISGTITIITAIINLIKEHNNNMHDEHMAEYEIDKMKLEIEKLKLEREEK